MKAKRGSGKRRNPLKIWLRGRAAAGTCSCGESLLDRALPFTSASQLSNTKEFTKRRALGGVESPPGVGTDSLVLRHRTRRVRRCSVSEVVMRRLVKSFLAVIGPLVPNLPMRLAGRATALSPFAGSFLASDLSSDHLVDEAVVPLIHVAGQTLGSAALLPRRSASLRRTTDRTTSRGP